MAIRAPRVTNWAGQQSCRPRQVVRPATEAELAALVRRAGQEERRVKVVGAAHSWTDAPFTDDLLVCLDRLDRVIAVDRESGRVTVEAGIRLAALAAALAACGLALPNLGSIAAQSVAGALATGTHGSAPRQGILATHAVGLRLLTATGETLDLAPAAGAAGDLFRAAQVSLGCLGIVTRLTLACVPAFDLERIAAPWPFERAVAELPDLVAREEWVKLWWLPHTDAVLVVCHRRTACRRDASRLARRVDETIVNRGLFAALLAAGGRFPRAIPAINRAVAAAYFRPARSVDRSDLALTIPMPARHLETESAVPVSAAPAALAEVRRLIADLGVAVDFIVELRFAAADDILLSPAQGRDTAFLGAYMASPHGRDRYFAEFERRMLGFGGRPHWGKLFGLGPTDLAAAFPGYAPFEALRRRLDPRGMWRNRFVDRVFGGE